MQAPFYSRTNRYFKQPRCLMLQLAVILTLCYLWDNMNYTSSLNTVLSFVMFAQIPTCKDLCFVKSGVFLQKSCSTEVGIAIFV